MNRILQKFVGDTSSASSNNRTPASTGNTNSSGGHWASASYQEHTSQSQQQQQYYGQQQPTSHGGGYGYHTTQQQYQTSQQGYVATNSQGQYLDEIPLSSPPANSKPDAATLFDDTHYSQQQQGQQSYYGYDVYNAQPEQQQYPAAADSFFQISHPVTSSGFAPPRSTSGSPDPFAQPPHSSTSSRSGSGGFGHFQESPADPFASSASLSFTTPASSNSLTGFEQQQEPVSLSRSTSATASDLFANAPPSCNGFDQQQVAYSGESHAVDDTLSVSGSAADLFAESSSAAIPSFYGGFAQQSDAGGWDSTDFAATPAASAELFASAAPAATSPPSPFDSFGHQQQYAQADYYAPKSESADAFGETSADPFAIPPQSSSSSSHSTGFSQQLDSVVDNGDPFASSSHSFTNSNNSFEQHFEQPPQQHQYYHSNQELGPFGNSTPPEYQQQYQADPFATMQPESEYASHIQSEPVDPFAQPVTAFGYQVQEHPVTAAAVATPVSLSPTQVNDFFSDASPSANDLFSSQTHETISKSPRPPLSPKRLVAAVTEPNGLGFSPKKPVTSNGEPSFEATAIPATTPTKKQAEFDPVAANDDQDEAADAIALQLKKTTLDDSHTLVEMYKHMAERLEGEKNELLKVLADQADQFYQMQEYIASLEQELAAHRSNGGKRVTQRQAIEGNRSKKTVAAHHDNGDGGLVGFVREVNQVQHLFNTWDRMAHHHHATAFQMPSYTSHTSRGQGAAGSPGRSKKHNFSNGDFSMSTLPGKPSRVQLSKSTHMDSDQSLLEMLSSTVACLKQKNMDLEALGCLEQSLWLKRRMFGVDNSVVQRALNEVVLSYNSVAMQYLAQTQFDQCLAMLRKAEAITAPGNFKKCQSLQILTFNNIGCCYRKLGKLKSALKYLKEAAQIGSTCAHVKNLSITHLNLCAIQSQLGRHDLALEHAQAAIFHTQEELVSLDAHRNDSDRHEDEDGDDNVGNDSTLDVLDAKSREEKIISLAVAYHNLAVELEFNGRGEASLQWYKKALQLVWKYRESNAALCASFKKIFMDAKKKQLQRTGGNSHGDSDSSRSTDGSSNSKMSSSVASRSSNAFSGGDRRKPVATRPKSAHYLSSRNAISGVGFSGRAAAASDLSYSATVASQCYKPTKPSAAGLQYASSSKTTESHGNRGAATQARRDFDVRSKAAPPLASNSRQRPMSASAVRPSSSVRHGDRGTAEDHVRPSIEAHWRKLEREFAIENPPGVNANSGTRASGQHQSRAAPAVKRPQSARPTITQKDRSSLNQCDDEDDSLCGIEDEDGDDCGVLDDDEPSDNEDGDDNLEDLEKSDEFEDLLLRRDNRQQQTLNQRSQTRNETSEKPRAETEHPVENAQQFAGRGHRHRQALEEARTKTTRASFDSEHTTTDDEDEGDLPNQRVSHMEYLRRMKRLAENIKDDLIGTIAPPSTAGNCRPNSATPSQHQKVSPLRPVPVATPSSGSQANASDTTNTTPRGSTSKVRERLERVRSQSFQTLPEFEGEVKSGEECQNALLVVENGDHSSVAKSSPKKQEFIEIVEDTTRYATEQDCSVAEQTLIRRAAAKHIQAFLRGERGRDDARMRQQQLREHEAALQIQLHARNFAQHSREQRLKDEEELLAQTQQFDIENLAASTIQQLYKKKFLLSDNDDNSRFAQSTGTLPTRTLEINNEFSRRQSEPRANSEFPQRQQQHQALDSSRRRHSAAVVIQATVKGFIAREVVAEHHATQLSRMYVERKHMEVALDHAMAKEQAFLEQLCAIKIQALVRGRQSRFLTEVTRIGLNVAAEKIQTSFRSHNKQLLKSTDVGVRSVAVRSIQHLVRGYLYKQSRLHQAVISEERSEVHHIAAASLQKFWRQVVARRELLLEELEAATCIQALGRGHLARKSCQSLRDSASQVGLYKPSSAFSIIAATNELPEYEQEDASSIIVEQRLPVVNMGFLPADVRKLYLSFVNTSSYREARADQQRSMREAGKQEVEDMGLTFEDLLLELETCADVATACFAINAMQLLVLFDTEAHCSLTNVIKAARVIDQRIQDRVVWTADVQQASLWLLDAFYDLLCAGV